MTNHETLTDPQDFLFQAHESDIRGTTAMEEAQKFIDQQLRTINSNQKAVQILDTILLQCGEVQRTGDRYISPDESLIKTLSLAAQIRLDEYRKPTRKNRKGTSRRRLRRTTI